METFLSILAGGLITFLASRHYYRKAAGDLRKETGALRRETEALRRETRDLKGYNIMLLHFLDDAGVIDVEWDPDTGEPRRIVPLTATVTAHSEVSADLQVTRRTGHTAEATGTASPETDVVRPEEQEAPTEQSKDR